MSETPTAGAVRVPGAHIADPAPLGLAAFALTTFVLSTVNAGWLPDTVVPVVFGLALAYGGIGQFAAGIWEFVAGDDWMTAARANARFLITEPGLGYRFEP